MLDTKSETKPAFEGLSNCGTPHMCINWRSFSRSSYYAYATMVVFLHALLTYWLSTKAIFFFTDVCEV